MVLRFLCMGDNHGDIDTIEKLLSEIEGESYDYIIHTGDLTNACFDGLAQGCTQLSNLEPLFMGLENHGEVIYITGNRDYETGVTGKGRLVTEEIDFEPGIELGFESDVEIGGVKFTRHPRQVDENTVLVQHHFETQYLDHYTGLLHLSGHTHTGRFKNRSLNTAFLHRPGDHGGEPLDGGYFEVVVDRDGGVEVDEHLWSGLEKGICPEHHSRGIQFTPSSWRKRCKFCYDDAEEEFFHEILESSEIQLKIESREVDRESLLEKGVEMYGDQVPGGLEDGLEGRLDELMMD